MESVFIIEWKAYTDHVSSIHTHNIIIGGIAAHAHSLHML
jgi:hypothetical protein